jgi:MoxR-like ATPase
MGIMGIFGLRAECRRVARERGEATSRWASASVEECKAYLEGSPVETTVTTSASPDTDNATALLNAIKAVAGESINEARVRSIVADAMSETKAATVDADAVRRIVDEAINAVPPIRFAVNGTTKTVEGVAHPVARTLAILCAAGVRTWIHGEAGTGKTTTARKIAEAAGMTVYCQPPSLTRYDVLGNMDAHSRVVETPVSRFVKATGPKCLLLDEVDSWGDGAQMAANLLLANGHAELPDGSFPLSTDNAPHWIVATANTVGKGATSQFTGRKRMDGAFIDRFDCFPEMPLHEPTERRIAQAIIAGSEAAQASKDAAESFVPVSFSIRAAIKAKGTDASWSPRKTYAAVRLILSGCSPAEAVKPMIGHLPSAQQTELLALVK